MSPLNDEGTYQYSIQGLWIKGQYTWNNDCFWLTVIIPFILRIMVTWSQDSLPLPRVLSRRVWGKVVVNTSLEAGVLFPQRNLLGSGWSWKLGIWGQGDYVTSHTSSYSWTFGHLFLVLSQLASTFAFSCRGLYRDQMTLLLHEAEMILWRGSLGLLQEWDRDEDLIHLRMPRGLTVNIILMFIIWGRSICKELSSCR